MAYISPALNVMIAAARKAGRPLIRDFNELENLQISMKGPADFVSNADLKSERTLREELSKALEGKATEFTPDLKKMRERRAYAAMRLESLRAEQKALVEEKRA